MTIYAIPDVHGHAEKLDRAHELIAADRAREGTRDAPVIHLGDLCDRGPDTRGVIDRLVAGLARGEPWRLILGNHDRMFRNFLAAGTTADPALRREATWLHPALGGVETLRSYGVDVAGRPLAEVQADATAAVPQAHAELLRTMLLWYETEEFLFVHAGIRPGVALRDQTEHDLVWIRDDFLDDPRPHPWLVVHGHTVVPEPAHFGNRVDLDGGAAFGGTLAAAVFEAGQAWLLDERGRRPLRPAFLAER